MLPVIIVYSLEWERGAQSKREKEREREIFYVKAGPSCTQEPEISSKKNFGKPPNLGHYRLLFLDP